MSHFMHGRVVFFYYDLLKRYLWRVKCINTCLLPIEAMLSCWPFGSRILIV